MNDLWSFKGVSFRRMDPAGQPRAWPRKLATTIDVVAGTPATTPRRYVDIGATEHQPWSIRAGCLSAADRAALQGCYGQAGALITVAGETYQALCTQADPETASGDGLYYLALTFELLS